MEDRGVAVAMRTSEGDPGLKGVVRHRDRALKAIAAQHASTHVFTGHEPFTHRNEGQRIAPGAMAPAVPHAFVKVDIEIVPRATAMLGMRPSEFGLGFVLKAGPVMGGDRGQVGLPRDRRARLGGAGTRGEIQ
jgi:hypothetical protein